MGYRRRLVWALLLCTCLVHELLGAVSVGDTVTLSCNYTRGDPPLPPSPTIIWKSPSGETLSNSKDFNLTLKNVSRSQSGTYTCHIPDVRFQRTVKLSVTDKVIVPDVEDRSVPTGGAVGLIGSFLHVLILLLLFY
ncbi:unnamed protein product [Knipowitschia caucasica]|uniref:Ig-like domain-containing protein n=1 Tax=Knipowitschia caucasica TaxID=637954 RepID=A0AAV2LCU0_KNICA